MDDIRKWLNGPREYHSGVELYLKHGNNKLLRRLFTAEDYSDFKKDKLTKALQDLTSEKKPPEQPTPSGGVKEVLTAPAADIQTIPVGEPSIPKPRRRWSENMDEVECSLFKKWKPLHSEMLDHQYCVGQLARGGLKNPVLKEKAGKMALDIIRLDQLCDEIYAQRNQYLDHGKHPEDFRPKKPCLDPLQWPTKVDNAERYIREWKLKLKKDTTNTKAAEKIKYYEQEKEYYEKKLNKQ
jgi:hypothetical protein